MATKSANTLSLLASKTDNVDIISPNTQSGQSPSPQKRNFCKEIVQILILNLIECE